MSDFLMRLDNVVAASPDGFVGRNEKLTPERNEELTSSL
jgi:hypothetical protein